MTQQSALVYEASVYSRTVNYKNFKGEEREVTLFFALDPLQLMQIIAGFKPKTKKRSGNPAAKETVEPITDAEQIQFVRDLCIKAAGEPSDDGESWYPYKEFETDLAGKAFLTKLASSDDDRKEFAEKVILAPFRAFVGFAKEDPTNSPDELKQFDQMLKQIESVFSSKGPDNETLEQRKLRLEAELRALAESSQADDES